MSESLPAPEERPRVGELFARLDEILRDLDRDDVELEEQMRLYREAVAHLGSARRILDEAHAEIEILMGDPDGATG